MNKMRTRQKQRIATPGNPKGVKNTTEIQKQKEKKAKRYGQATDIADGSLANSRPFHRIIVISG